MGEVKIYNFSSIIEALKFLKGLENNEEKMLNTDNAPTLFESSEVRKIEDNEEI